MGRTVKRKRVEDEKQSVEARSPGKKKCKRVKSVKGDVAVPELGQGMGVRKSGRRRGKRVRYTDDWDVEWEKRLEIKLTRLTEQELANWGIVL